MLKGLKTDILLFFQSPKDYLYSFTYSKKEYIKQKPFDPNSLNLAKKLINKIESACPEIKIYLIGSIGLGIPGKGDIDLYTALPLSKFDKVIPKINSIFEKPVKIRKNFVQWEHMEKGILVELTLIDPKNKRFQEQLGLFNLLKNNKTLLNEYKDLKESLDMCSKREYAKKRMEFFNKIRSRK